MDKDKKNKLPETLFGEDFEFVVMDPVDPFGNCELCGTPAQLRPWGPGRKMICVKCGVKNPEETTKQIFKDHGIDFKDA